MTFRVLWKTICHYWKSALAVFLACVIVSAICCFIVPKYEATATVTVSDPSGNVSAVNLMAVTNSVALEEASPYFDDDSDVSVSVVVGTASAAQTLSITAEAADPERCLAVANEIASRTVARSEEMFEVLEQANEEGLADLSTLSSAEDVSGVLSGALLQDVLGTDRTFEFCTFLLNNAVEVDRAGFGIAVLLAIGVIGGILLAVATVMVLDHVKEPIRGRRDVEDIASCPVLFSGSPATAGERLWANVQFRAEKELGTICLVPLDEGAADECARSMERAIEGSSSRGKSPQAGGVEVPRVVACHPITDDVATSYAAHEASAVVVCVRQWDDARMSLERALSELKAAHANVVGVALFTS